MQTVLVGQFRKAFGAIVSGGAGESLLCSKEEAEGNLTILIATMTKLLKAQTEVIAAEAQVAITLTSSTIYWGRHGS